MGRILKRQLASKENTVIVDAKAAKLIKPTKAVTGKLHFQKSCSPMTLKNRPLSATNIEPRMALFDKTNSISAKLAPASCNEKQHPIRSASRKKCDGKKVDVKRDALKRKLSPASEASQSGNSSFLESKENKTPNRSDGKRLTRLKKSPVRKLARRECQRKLDEYLPKIKNDRVSPDDEANSAENLYKSKEEWNDENFLGFADDEPDIKEKRFMEWVACSKDHRIPQTYLAPLDLNRPVRQLRKKQITSSIEEKETSRASALLQHSRIEKGALDKNSVGKKGSPSSVTRIEFSTDCKTAKKSPLKTNVSITLTDSRRGSRPFDDFKVPKNVNHSAEYQTPKVPKEKQNLKKLPAVKSDSSPRKSPRLSTPLFTVFRKSSSPRHYSSQNRIFVSRDHDASEEKNNDAKLQPVYVNPAMTPIGKKRLLPVEEKEGLYDFEVDENEPKPKKKHRPILKIQRKRHVNKKKKLNNYIVDPEVEKRVLRNLDLSPSVLEQPKPQLKPLPLATATPGTASSSRQVPLSESHVQTSVSQPAPANASLNQPCALPSHAHTSAEELRMEKEPNEANRSCNDDADCDDDHFAADSCPSSPAHHSPPQTPANRTNCSVGSLSNKTSEMLGQPLKAKFFSPRINNSPIPVLLANRASASSTPNASRMTRGSHESLHEMLNDIGASTPIKNRHDDTTYIEDRPPVKADISNCFGFDEPDSIEEPLVSPIKRDIRINYDRPVAPSPSRTILEFRRKPPINSPLPSRCVTKVDVKEVIQKLKAEVGVDPDSSEIAVDMFSVDGEKQMPIKRYLVTEPLAKADEVVETTSGIFEETPSVIQPRLSYSCPARTRKRKNLPECDETSFIRSSADEAEESFEEELPKKKKKKVLFKDKKEPAKKREKGMNKKEEEALEKWAEQFNSQCAQISGYGLCVE